ncbi:MAG: hypothetical protein LBU64_09120 [Planctomycetota bacterium]|jgi:tetratricopeptide (TPR) repeat protein|nr:hypothetical protein [Planctomycetota bacterium]
MAGKRMTRRAPFRIAYEGDGDEDEYDDGEDDGDGAGGAVPGGRGKRLAALLALKGLKGHGGNRSREKSQAINLRAHLLSMDKEALVALLLEQAKADDALRERLDLSAAVANPDGVDLASLRRRIDKALELPYFDYDNPYWDEEDPYEGYADQMKPVLSALETLLEKGGAASVAALAEYALTGLNKQCREMEYDFVESGEVVRPLAELHARACAVTKPDPHVLADWLFRFGVRDSADYFGCLPWEKYGPALGKAGLDHFRRLIEKEWKGIPALKTPAGTDSHWLLRSRLQEIVMRFAREDGDVDAQAEAAKKDLSEADGYLAVARIYQSAKRYDEALEWAEKGWKAFRTGRYDRNPELRDLLAREYRRQGRNAEAMDLYWSEFAEHPDLDGYRELKKQAEKEKAWPSWRAKAFELIREAVAAAKKKGNKRRTGTGGWAPPCYGIYPGDNHSLLVEILLWEGKPEEAWREAEAGDCSEDLWLRLAAWREKGNPRDCLPIWRRRVERLTQRADQHDYVPAAESLAKLGELMTRTGAGGEFAAYMRTIRSELGRRRNFISELDRRKLP